MSASQEFRKMAADLLRLSRRKERSQQQRDADYQMAQSYKALAAKHAWLSGEPNRRNKRTGTAVRLQSGGASRRR
jgi:hypothetical protein